jgi:hypothetical protein
MWRDFTRRAQQMPAETDSGSHPPSTRQLGCRSVVVLSDTAHYAGTGVGEGLSTERAIPAAA